MFSNRKKKQGPSDDRRIQQPVQVQASGRGRFRSRDQGFICDPTRILRPVSEPYNADSGFVSSIIGPAVSKKAFALQVVKVDPSTMEEHTNETQISLLKVPKADGSEGFDVVPVTASSTVGKLAPDDVMKILIPPSTTFRGVAPPPAGPTDATLADVNRAIQQAHVVIPQKTLRLATGSFPTLEGGGDSIAKGQPVTSPVLLESVRHYEKVPAGCYQPQVGQRIGMAIFSEEGATPESCHAPSVSQQQVIAIFGKPGQVMVYSGTIMNVLEDGKAIEHDINTYDNCAGAIVFLLDRDQPGDAVSEECFGKAIAVHSEALSNELPTGRGNVAMLL